MTKKKEEVFERRVTFLPAYDKRNDPRGDYGIGSVEMRFYLIGKKGAIQFVVGTGWYLPHVIRKRKENGYPNEPFPSDIGYHSPKPIFKGQEPMSKKCAILNGRTCYHDGSGLQAMDVFNILCAEGSDGMWKEMERRYHELFDGKKAT